MKPSMLMWLAGAWGVSGASPLAAVAGSPLVGQPPPHVVQARADPHPGRPAARAYQRARLTTLPPEGAPESSLTTIFLEEPRHEAWASAMEERLKERFSKKRLRALRLSAVRLREATCHQSSCKLSFEWRIRDEERMRSAGLIGDPLDSPVGALWDAQGPFADLDQADPPQRKGHALKVEDHYLAFSEREIQPERYEAWVEAGRQINEDRQRRRHPALDSP